MRPHKKKGKGGMQEKNAKAPRRHLPNVRCVVVPVAGPTLGTDGRKKLTWSSSACVWTPRDVFVVSQWGKP